MTIINIVILLLIISIILKELKHIKNLVIPTSKSHLEIITILFSIIVMLIIMYLYAKALIHYITGLLCILMFICMWLKKGITSQGFISMSRGNELISWDKIEKVNVLRSKDIKVALFGGFMEQTFNFKNDDYDKVIDILKENLPHNADLQIIKKDDYIHY